MHDYRTWSNCNIDIDVVIEHIVQIWALNAQLTVSPWHIVATKQKPNDSRHAIGLCPHQPSENPAEAYMQYTCMFPGHYHYARVKCRSSDLGGVEENVSYLPTSKNEPLLLLSLCLPQAALGQTCLLSGMERALEK